MYIIAKTYLIGGENILDTISYTIAHANILPILA